MRGISLSKVYEASLAMFLAALLVSLRWDSLAVSLGLTIGTALAVGLLATWQVLIRRAFDPAAPRKAPVVLFGLLKLPVIGAVVYLAVGRGWVDPIAFAAGVSIPQAALVVMALGSRFLSGGTGRVSQAHSLQRSEA